MVIIRIIRSVQSIGPVRLFVTPWTATCQASLSITISQSLLKLMSTKLVVPSNHLIFCRPFLLLSSIFPASGSSSVSQLLASSGQSTGASALAPVLPMNIQGWFPLGLTGLSSCCPRDSQESSPTLDNILIDKYTYRIYTILNTNTAQERKKNNDSIVENKK